MNKTETLVPVRALLRAWTALARKGAGVAQRPERLKVFLECDAWFEDRIRSEVDFVRYVHDRQNADVCISVTLERPVGAARYYRIRLVGAGPFNLIEASARLSLHRDRATDSRRSDSEARRKKRIAAFTPSHATG